MLFLPGFHFIAFAAMLSLTSPSVHQQLLVLDRLTRWERISAPSDILTPDRYIQHPDILTPDRYVQHSYAS